MPDVETIDTFPSFLECWGRIRGLPVEEQVDRWLADFRAQWRDLAEKVEQSYAADGLEWRTVLRERVFPYLPERLPMMAEAWGMLREGCPRVRRAAQERLGLDFEVVFVLLAIGYGGWATEYGGTRACLLGLDTIAECDWANPEALSGLVAHELGHLLHLEWRARRGLGGGQGPVWQVYEEGFAQRCEHLALGGDTFHMQGGQEGWLAWCLAHQSWLAEQFLSTVAAGEPVYRFFGSWPECTIEGRREMGHFLAHQVVAEWQAELSLRDIALLTTDEVDRGVRETLQKMAAG